MSPCTRGRRRGRSALPRRGSPRYGAWYETTRRTLPLRIGQALPASRQARAGPGAPCHRDKRIPRDGHAVLAGEGGDGVEGAVLGVMNDGRSAMRASDDVSLAGCKGVWWVRRRTALALMLSAVALAVLGLTDSATAQALHTQVANSLRVEWQRTTSLGGRPAIEGYVYNDSQFRIGGVRLRVEILDGSNQVVGETFGWVYGNISSRLRWPTNHSGWRWSPSTLSRGRHSANRPETRRRGVPMRGGEDES